MKKYILTLTILVTLFFGTHAEIHAVLAAGSKSYENYRHQSDICHAYQILIKNGVPANNIIVMAYNDIANNPHNPVPGAIFNKPTATGTKGENVYEGCIIDYEGEDVNPDNYLAIITGDSNKVKGGNGRVLQSGKNDEVFLNFVGYGSPAGYLHFPRIEEVLKAKQLIDAFDTMVVKEMFKQMTFYLDASFSGSMFQDLKKDTRIYAVSSSRMDQPSWSAHCPPHQDFVDGVKINACLGNLFSVNWMENTEQSNLNKETLQQQFQIVRDNIIEGQEVQQWGDLSFTDEVIGKFMGGNQNNIGFLNKVQKVQQL